MERAQKYPNLLTVPQLAAYLQVAEKTIYNLASQKRIPYVKAGGALRFSIEQIDRWLARNDGISSFGATGSPISSAGDYK